MSKGVKIRIALYLLIGVIFAALVASLFGISHYLPSFLHQGLPYPTVERKQYLAGDLIVSNDGKRVAFSEEGLLSSGQYFYSMSVNGDDKEKLSSRTFDGSQLAVVSDEVSGICLLTYKGENRHCYPHLGDAINIGGLAFSPDGRRLAYRLASSYQTSSTESAGIYLLNIDNGEHHKIATGASQLHWASNDQLLYLSYPSITEREGDVHLLDIRNGDDKVIYRARFDSKIGLPFSANLSSSQIVVSGFRGLAVLSPEGKFKRLISCDHLDCPWLDARVSYLLSDGRTLVLARDNHIYLGRKKIPGNRVSEIGFSDQNHYVFYLESQIPSVVAELLLKRLDLRTGKIKTLSSGSYGIVWNHLCLLSDNNCGDHSG